MKNKMRKRAALFMTFVMVASMIVSQPAEAAKKPSLNKKSVVLKAGKTVKLKVKHAKKKAKVTWKSSKKKVAKIVKKTKKGNAYAKIKGLKKGKATITAKYKAGKVKKTLKCTVKVTGKGNEKNTDNPAATKTPGQTNPSASPTASNGAGGTGKPTVSATATATATATSGTPFTGSFTDEQGVYHNYLGTILKNPSVIYGDSFNNHHHMQSFKGHDYIFYHSTVLGNTLFRDGKKYRNLHVDEINVDEKTDQITIEPSYEGVKQIENFNPYKNYDGSVRYVNATTAAKSAGVKSTRDDRQVVYSINGSPMVLDEIDTGDWTMIKGVDFGESGLKNIGMEYKAGEDKGRVEVFLDDPTDMNNRIATIDILEAADDYTCKNVKTDKAVTGVHSVYFVFRGSNYQIASWIFSEDENAALPDLSKRPAAGASSGGSDGVNTGWNENATEYTMPLNEETLHCDEGATWAEGTKPGSIVIEMNGQYPGVWFSIPDDVKQTFSSIEFTYEGATAGGFGATVNFEGRSYKTDCIFGDVSNPVWFQAGEGEQTQSFDLEKGTGASDYENKTFAHFKVFRNNSENVTLTINSVVLKRKTPATTPTPSPTPTPTQKPNPTPTDFEKNTQNYSYFNDYTLGWKNGVVAYKNGERMNSLDDVDAEVYNKKDDNIFGQHIKNNNWWSDKITLTQPLQYTLDNGEVKDINSMLTNYDFAADPTAIDNSDVDGKLYVYGTTEGIKYKNGVLEGNGDGDAYANHSLTILSTQDMVNWTDEGTMDNQNLTNEPSSAPAKNKVKCKWASKAWAPSGIKIDADGDGKYKYYLFYTNSGAIGYVQSDSPTGPWKDDLGTVLFNQSAPNCKDVTWCFDPAALVDDKGNAYVYFGGGIPSGGDNAHPKTARVCKIRFEEGTGKVLMDGEPQELDNYYMFEDSEINQFHGKYYYSYCTNFNVKKNNWVSNGEIACYVSSDPMNISFDPESVSGK